MRKLVVFSMSHLFQALTERQDAWRDGRYELLAPALGATVAVKVVDMLGGEQILRMVGQPLALNRRAAADKAGTSHSFFDSFYRTYLGGWRLIRCLNSQF